MKKQFTRNILTFALSVAFLLAFAGTAWAADTTAATTSGATSDQPVTTAASSYPISFNDVKASDWFYADVEYACVKNLMQGTSATNFEPNVATNRAMLVTILNRMAGSPVVNYAMNFSDVKDDTWYTEAVRWAASEKISLGYSDNTFRPKKALTREDLAVFLFRFAKQQGYDTTQGGMSLREYADYDKIADYAKSAMQWCVIEKIIAGGSNNKINPTATATRAEMAAMLHRFCETQTTTATN